jgi:hypothetical protein
MAMAGGTWDPSVLFSFFASALPHRLPCLSFPTRLPNLSDSRRTSHATFSLRARLCSLCALPLLRFGARQTRTGSIPPGPLSLDESPRGAAPLAPRCVLFFLAFAVTRMACDWSRFCRLVLAAVEPEIGGRLAAQPLVPVPGSNLRRAILPSWF